MGIRTRVKCLCSKVFTSEAIAAAQNFRALSSKKLLSYSLTVKLLKIDITGLQGIQKAVFMESIWESPFSFPFWLLEAAGLLGPLAPSLCTKPANGGVCLTLFHSDKPPMTTAHHLHPCDEGHRSSITLLSPE